MEELKARVRELSEVDSDADTDERLFKKRRLEKSTMIHPGAKVCNIILITSINNSDESTNYPTTRNREYRCRQLIYFVIYQFI
jgi:hypothetical protein